MERTPYLGERREGREERGEERRERRGERRGKGMTWIRLENRICLSRQ